ncbi:MAG: UvrD-helicase domain-containing protein, partial [Pseudomonadota bacterium]
YFAIKDALKTNDKGRFLGTLEFFPEEGKYHFDGHRKCNARLDPVETRRHGGICPVCGKPVTLGVMYRVEELADRSKEGNTERGRPFQSLIALGHILSEVLRVGHQSKRVKAIYHNLIRELGSELYILRKAPIEDIGREGTQLLAEAIRRMRNSDVSTVPGYDGEFGKIRLFAPHELEEFSGQQLLFKLPNPSSLRLSRRKPEDCVDLNRPARAAKPSRTQREFEWPGVFHGLNPEQQDAVRHTGSPLLIVAGPGTGKTRTIIHRIAYLISSKIAQPEEVLAVTFTNRAANEIKERLKKLVNDMVILSKMKIMTFHALCLDIIKKEHELLGVQKDVFLLGDHEKLALLKAIIPSGSDISMLADAISRAKQNLISPDQDLKGVAADIDADVFRNAYNCYQDWLSKNHSFDFDELIFRVVLLFENNQAIKEDYQRHFKFISVDEYQDINHAQYRLVKALAPACSDLCVIGDPDQAIYGFRGADPFYFNTFRNDYPSAKSLFIFRNYRSSETILEAAQQVLGKTGHKERFITGLHGGDLIVTTELPTERSEAEFVIKNIEAEIGGISHFSIESRKIDTSHISSERGFSDFVVLYRLNEQGNVLEEAFERSGIPYQRIGKDRFIDKRGIRELLYCLRFSDPMLRNSLGMDIFTPPGLKDIDAEVLKTYADGDLNVVERIKKIVQGVPFFIGLCAEKTFQEDLNHLLNIAEGFDCGCVAGFLSCLRLDREADLYDARSEKVSLMTLHAAKGLEFSVVFIVGCEAGILPYAHATGEMSNLEEERRLFYVGLTRAKEKVFCTYAKKRFLFGRERNADISPFLLDIDQALKKQGDGFDKKKKGHVQLKLFE